MCADPSGLIHIIERIAAKRNPFRGSLESNSRAGLEPARDLTPQDFKSRPFSIYIAILRVDVEC